MLCRIRLPLRPAYGRATECLLLDGKTDIDFTNIALAAALSDVNEKMPLKIRHLDGTIADVEIAAEKLPGSSPQIPRGFGIMQGQTLTIADNKDPNAAFRKLGLEPDDTIVAVNGKEIKGSWDLTDILEKTLEKSIQVTADSQRQNNRQRNRKLMLQFRLILSLVWLTEKKKQILIR